MLQTPIEYRQTRLDNGICVVSESVPSTYSVGVTVLVDASPCDEASDKSGLAHYCEHALFLGTPLRDQISLTRLIDSAGGQLGAFTAPDYTCFYAHVLQDYTSYAVDLLGDILVSSNYPQELLDREKEVIVQEIRGGDDQPHSFLTQQIKQTLWPDQRISRPVTGTVESVRGLGRSDVVSFVSRHYTPDRITVAAAGAIDHESFAEQVQDAFWTLRGHGPERSKETIQPVGGVSVSPAGGEQAYFSIAIPTTAFVDTGRYELHLLNALLGGGLSSRLQVKLRDESGLVYFVQSSLLAYRDAGCLLIEGSCSAETLLPVLEQALFELAGLALWQHPVDEEELWKTAMQLRGQTQLAADIVSNRVASLATQQFHFGHRIEDQRIVQAIDEVSLEQLKDQCLTTLAAGFKHLSIAVKTPGAAGDGKGSVYSDINELRDSFVAISE